MYSITYQFLIRCDLFCTLFTLQTRTNCSEPPTDYEGIKLLCTLSNPHRTPFFVAFFGGDQIAKTIVCSTLQVVSTSTHWSKGNVDRELVAFAIVGALLGGFLGGSIAAILPERALRLIFVPRFQAVSQIKGRKESLVSGEGRIVVVFVVSSFLEVVAGRSSC